MKNIVIFASGTGTNAENIIRYFSNEKKAKVTLVLSNKPQAKVLERAAALGVDSVFFDRGQFYETGEVQLILRNRKTDLIVLAGFLWLVPRQIIEEYRGRIINIHPALLPQFGGAGMYGERVHRAVLEAGCSESGITIHYVNEEYDSGDIIFQAKCPVLPGDDTDALAARVHTLEYRYYPEVICKIIDALPSQ
ncbi:MAG: phosphoribosylglycinamide formyltransferase [Bacteroidales bacterium]|jgi:phosphoribosylglycinamide formyltransferase-1|nr:phosphoribosylglycinamide formyltransferase [Bacteroidales bacterium]